MTKELKAQELYLKNLREASRLGMSRFTAFLMWKCENDSEKQRRAERGRTYPQLLTYNDLLLK